MFAKTQLPTISMRFMVIPIAPSLSVDDPNNAIPLSITR